MFTFSMCIIVVAIVGAEGGYYAGAFCSIVFYPIRWAGESCDVGVFGGGLCGWGEVGQWCVTGGSATLVCMCGSGGWGHVGVL